MESLKSHEDLASAVKRLIALRASRKPTAPLLGLVEVRNFRNVRAARLEMAPVTVLIGGNNSGKTSLLTSIACLFPQVLEAKLTSFGGAVGDTGSDSEADLFINFRRDSRPVRLGARTANGSFWIDLRNRYSLVEVSWQQGTETLATLVASSDLRRRRWLPEPTGTIDGRRLGKKSAGPRAQDYEIAELLQAELVGSARIALNLVPEAEGPHLDVFEAELPALAKSCNLKEGEFINAVSAKLGIPELSFVQHRYVNFPIVPTPALGRRRTAERSQLMALISILQQNAHSTGQAGRSALAQARADLAALDDRGGGVEGGGLSVGQHGGLVKSLGSGHRRALLLGAQLLTHDLCLIDEPEIYLHPEMLERLLDFILERSRFCQVVLTTHSGVVIDYLHDRPNVRMYEVVRELRKPYGQLVDVASRRVRDLIKGLGWRPSHVLQASVIIWVEGPSDAVYIRRWIELWTQGRLRSDRHYVCLTYGGSSLKYLLGSGALDAGGVLDLSSTAILICDSDRDSASDPVSPEKEAVIAKVIGEGGYAFLTDGREIENYLPRRLIAPEISVQLPEDYSYLDIPRLLGRNHGKMGLAAELAPLFLRSDIENSPTLLRRVSKICALISAWARVDFDGDKLG